MNIGTKERIATGTALASIALIAATIWWAHGELEHASRQREQAGEVVRGLSELRLVTFDYSQGRLERPRLQWLAVAARLDRRLADNDFSGPAQTAILRGLVEKRTTANGIFAELTAAPAGMEAHSASEEASRRFAAQLFGRLLILQQDNFADAYRLADLTSERIDTAQRRVLVVILAGLALVAAILAGASWLLRIEVLAPIGRLQAATREMAAGNLEVRLGFDGNDEIADLAKNFDAMTDSLRASFARLGQSNQALTALNQELEAFSYSVSHDLRGPLRSMDGFSLALLEDYADKLDAEGKDALARIRAASQRMGRLIDDLLGLSRVTRADIKPKRVNLGAIARDIESSLRQEQPGRNVTLEVEDGLWLHADPSLIEIALRNLLENAWKFTARANPATVRVGALDHEDGKAYFVADNGVGFDPAHAGQLFGAFQRLHSVDEFPGTGIGLAIVSRIVRRHGGRIWAEAKPGAGATFFFTVGAVEDGNHG